MPDIVQKSGIQRRRKRELSRFDRDSQIYRRIQNSLRGSEIWHKKKGEKIEPLSLYFGKPEKNTSRLISHFPLPLKSGEVRFPKWSELSKWLKIQTAMLLMHEYASLVFHIHIHPKLERKWYKEGRNPCKEVRNRIRKELAKLDNCPAEGMDWFFSIEGFTDTNKRYPNRFKKIEKTYLHIHGAIGLVDGIGKSEIELAIGRACGHGLRGYSVVPSAISTESYERGGPAFGIYVLKYERRRDDRLAERRVAFSRSLTQASEDFWNGITGRWDEYHQTLYAEKAMAAKIAG